MASKLPNITMEDITIIFRNFAGKATEFNREGDRNFCVVLPQDVAERMAKDGYNIKERPPREEGDEPLRYIQVKINYRGRPPKIVLVTSRGRTTLGEDEVGTLDWADIVKADVIVGPYEWEVRGATGISCYVQSLFVTIREDELELKYADVPESGASGRSWTADD